MPTPSAQERTCLETIIAACQAALAPEPPPEPPPEHALRDAYALGKRDGHREAAIGFDAHLRFCENSARPALPSGTSVADMDGLATQIREWTRHIVPGGNWYNGGTAGLWYLNLNTIRSKSHDVIGYRNTP